MDNQSNPDGDAAHPVRKEQAAAEPKRPYRAPRLTVYGTLHELTLAKGGTKADTTVGPASRV